MDGKQRRRSCFRNEIKKSFRGKQNIKQDLFNPYKTKEYSIFYFVCLYQSKILKSVTTK